MTSKTVTVALATIAITSLSAAAGNAATITFDNAGSPGVFLSQNCCDAPGLDLSFRGVSGVGNGATALPSLTFWRSGVAGYSYGDLGDVAYVGAVGLTGEVRFDVLDSNILTLNSLDLGSGQGVARTSQVNAFDLDYNLLFSSGFTVPAVGHATILLGGLSSASGLILQFGPDGYDVAIDNIVYDIRPMAVGIPEANTWAMMIFGFGLIGASMRRSALTELRTGA